MAARQMREFEVIYRSDRIVRLSPESVVAARNFGNERVGNGDLYDDSKQDDAVQVGNDCYIGGRGEEGVSKSLGAKCSKPDFTYYPPAYKSYKADLLYGPLKEELAVKAQITSQSKKFGGPSWFFQLETARRQIDPILVDPRGKIAFTLTPEKFHEYVVIMAIVDATAVIPWLVQEPFSKCFVGEKKAIYWYELDARIKAGTVKDYADEWMLPESRCFPGGSLVQD